MKHRIVHALQKYVLNPPIKILFAVGIAPPGYALLETTGCKTGIGTIVLFDGAFEKSQSALLLTAETEDGCGRVLWLGVSYCGRLTFRIAHVFLARQNVAESRLRRLGQSLQRISVASHCSLVFQLLMNVPDDVARERS